MKSSHAPNSNNVRRNVKRGNVKRRLFLQGLGGAALATPYLSSLTKPAQAQSADPQRLVIFYTNNGCWVPDLLTHPVDGPLDGSTMVGKTLDGLSDMTSKLLYPRNLAMFPRGNVEYNGVTYFDPHDQGMGSKLTCAPIDSAGNHYATARSLDHVAAELVNPRDKTPLVLSVGTYFENVKGVLSYVDAATPYPPELNPNNVYSRLTGMFSGATGTGGSTEADYRVSRGNSIIDLVRDDLQGFKAQPLGASDKKRVDDWLELLRETEQLIVPAACDLGTATALGISDEALAAASPSGRGFGGDVGTAFTLGSEMMIKLIALTMMCDANRVIVLQWPGFVTFNFDGLDHQYDHHGISHRNGSAAVGGEPLPNVEFMIKDIDQWYGRKFTSLVKLLDSIDEGERTMLDNSATMWLPELSDGNAHNNDNLPIVIAGSMGGYLKQGVSVNADTSTSSGGGGGGGGFGGFGSGGHPINQLYTTLLNGLGARNADGSMIESFGNTDSNSVGTITKPGELEVIKA